MPPRPNWKGYLKLSLVSCPVAMFAAASAAEKVTFHMLNAETGNRLKQQYFDAETGDVVDRDERVKGYEIAKGDYVVVTDEELDAIEIESSHTIDVQSFAPRTDVDPIYFDNSYYIAPDDKVGVEAFAVIREAMRVRDVVGLARVVLFGRERMVMLEPRDKGIVMTSLRYDYEVRDDKAYFDVIPKVEISKEMLDLALHIIDVKTARFNPATFKDAYRKAVIDLVRAKRAGRPPPAPRATAPSNVINLMDALRRSSGPEGGKNAKRPSAKTTVGPAPNAPAAKEKSSTSTHKAVKPRVRKAG